MKNTSLVVQFLVALDKSEDDYVKEIKVEAFMEIMPILAGNICSSLICNKRPEPQQNSEENEEDDDYFASVGTEPYDSYDEWGYGVAKDEGEHW